MGADGRHLTDLSIAPASADAGDSIVVTLTMRAGPAGLPQGALLAIDCPGYLGASRPQFLYQEQEGFVSVDVSDPDAPFERAIATADRTAWARTGQDYAGLVEKKYRPYRLICLTFPAGVKPGAAIAVRLGEGHGGFGTGYRVGVVSLWPGFRHRFLVKVFASSDAPAPLEEHALALEVRAREACQASVVRRATGAGRIVFRDRFGNVSRVERLGRTAIERKADHARRKGCAPVALSDCAPMHDVYDGLSLFWGDLHAHSAFSCDCKRTERSEVRPADMLRFAREAACLDFLALTDHHFVDRPDQALSEAEWQETLDAARLADAPGEFVALAGIEYRCDRGDTVALFGSPPPYGAITRPEDDRIDRFWASLRGYDLLTMPHFHSPGRLPEGEWIAPDDPMVEPAMEVFSCHGRFDQPRAGAMPLAPPEIKALRADRNARWMLDRGLRYAILCSSDDHKTRPGTNGLAAVFAQELTREALFEALRRRRCYGTTSARIRLVFAANDALMGSEVRGGSSVRFRIEVRGTAPLRWVGFYRNGELARRFTPSGPDFSEHVEERVVAPAYYLVKVFQDDMEMAFSSPIWVIP